MTAIFQLLAWVCGAGSLVCFILVLIQMFRHGYVGLAIGCILFSLCCVVGALVAFVFGWSKAREWGITDLMTWWTAFVVTGVLTSSLGGAVQFLLRPLGW